VNKFLCFGKDVLFNKKIFALWWRSNKELKNEVLEKGANVIDILVFDPV